MKRNKDDESNRGYCSQLVVTTPDPNVAVGHLCEPFKGEMVIRGYMSGHAAREYKLERLLCGVEMPDGLKENDKFQIQNYTCNKSRNGRS